MVSTSKGRGRLLAAMRSTPTTSTTSVVARNVNRWRHRRKTTVATSSAKVTKNIVHPVATRSTARAAVLSQPMRMAATLRRTGVERSVIRRAPEDTIMMINQTRTARDGEPARPERPIWRGSGGGAPDGRRRRRSGCTDGGHGRVGCGCSGRAADREESAHVHDEVTSVHQWRCDRRDVGAGFVGRIVQIANFGRRQAGRDRVDDVDQSVAQLVDDGRRAPTA